MQFNAPANYGLQPSIVPPDAMSGIYGCPLLSRLTAFAPFIMISPFQVANNVKYRFPFSHLPFTITTSPGTGFHLQSSAILHLIPGRQGDSPEKPLENLRPALSCLRIHGYIPVCCTGSNNNGPAPMLQDRRYMQKCPGY